MKMLESSGRSIEEAIEAGLSELDLTIDEVIVETVEEGSKGFLGFGAKPARVRLTQKDTPALRAEIFLDKLTALMGVAVRIDVTEEEGHLHIAMTGESAGVLIGHRGETMDAIQYLTSLEVNKGGGNYTRVHVDIENYRAKREESLVRLAQKMAAKAKKTGRRVVLEPMNPYERRVLHSALQEDTAIATHSEGEDPNRRVVITLK